MRYAFVSDIHGNLEALKNVFRSIRLNCVDKIIFLGDLVGYGPNPNECVEIIRRMGIESIMGNHDFLVSGNEGLELVNDWAAKALFWTSMELKRENLFFLENLSEVAIFSEITVVHASPLKPREWNYVDNVIEALAEFEGFDGKYCFIGHSHVPVAYSDVGDVFRGNSIELSKKNRYLINVGSVGQPRDGDNRACYGILDTGANIFFWVRVRYNFNKTAVKIKNAGLPILLAERLRYGK